MPPNKFCIFWFGRQVIFNKSLYYIDDILILSDNVNLHLKHLDIFADLCIKHGLALSEKKTSLLQEKIDFLGLKIDGKGIELQSHILEKITVFPNKFTYKRKLNPKKCRCFICHKEGHIRYIDFTGIFPRINYLQGNSPEEIRYWYDFGAVNKIYLTLPDFPEISFLPKWVKDGVRYCYLNNPTITPKDVMALKLFSTGPDFYNEFNHIENIKYKLRQCYTDNPLQFLNRNQIMAKLEMKDKDKEIRVKP